MYEMLLEVIGLTAEDVVQAQLGGAKRIELVSAMEQAGLSPTIETIQSVLAVSEIPVRVMVRFHDNGFVYTQEEQQQMLDWMHAVGTLGFDGYVIGAMTAEGTIDEEFLTQVMEVAHKYNKKVTFHRAFDTLPEAAQEAGLKVLEQHGVNTVLTSAGYDGAMIDKVARLIALQDTTTVEILAGGGVNMDVIRAFKGTSVTNTHVGSAVRVNGDFTQAVNAEMVQELVNL